MDLYGTGHPGWISMGLATRVGSLHPGCDLYGTGHPEWISMGLATRVGSLDLYGTGHPGWISMGLATQVGSLWDWPPGWKKSAFQLEQIF